MTYCSSLSLPRLTTSVTVPAQTDYICYYPCPDWLHLLLSLPRLTTYVTVPAQTGYTCYYPCPDWLHLLLSLPRLTTSVTIPAQTGYTCYYPCPDWLCLLLSLPRLTTSVTIPAQTTSVTIPYVWEMKMWEESTCCIDVVLPLCSMDIKWTQKRPVATIILILLSWHLIVWPQPSSRVTHCPFLSQLKSSVGWSVFVMVFWIIFPSLTLIENYSCMFLPFISVVWNSL
jgi:hypothetical protein